jgi:hypothetical protein
VLRERWRSWYGFARERRSNRAQFRRFRVHGSARNRQSLSHNAYVPERATIHYRWSVWFGSSLSVVRRIDHGQGDWLICELPDGSTQTIPAWMADAALCATFSSGPPEVSVSALTELFSYLRALNSSVKSNQLSEIAALTEYLNEAAETNE